MSKIFTFRVTESELENIKLLANRSNLPVADYIRRALSKREVSSGMHFCSVDEFIELGAEVKRLITDRLPSDLYHQDVADAISAVARYAGDIMLELKGRWNEILLSRKSD